MLLEVVLMLSYAGKKEFINKDEIFGILNPVYFKKEKYKIEYPMYAFLS